MGSKFRVRIFMGTKLKYFQQKADLKQFFGGIVIWDQGCFKDETVWDMKKILLRSLSNSDLAVSHMVCPFQ